MKGSIIKCSSFIIMRSSTEYLSSLVPPRRVRGYPHPLQGKHLGSTKTESNKKEGRQMLEQQVRNVLRHLKDAHGIENHLVVKAILPKGTPPP